MSYAQFAVDIAFFLCQKSKTPDEYKTLGVEGIILRDRVYAALDSGYVLTFQEEHLFNKLWEWLDQYELNTKGLL